MIEPPSHFLNVPELLELSKPRPRVNWFWYCAGAFLLISMVSAYLSDTSPMGRVLVDGGAVFFTMAVIGAMSFYTMTIVRRLRQTQMQIEAAQELAQLRRWDQAAVMISQVLSRPLRTAGLRLEALLCLTSILARYHRFDDAIAVQDHLLEMRLDPITERAVKLARAMAMLREDQLSDADRAMSDLRRGEGKELSAGLSLLEIYRDVKTGHPNEAIEIFRSRQTVLRDQLGFHVADAYALAARAFDLLDQGEEAGRAFYQATLLTPGEELARRYPDIGPLVGKYPAATPPAEPKERA